MRASESRRLQLAAGLLALLTAFPAVAENWMLGREAWSRPRSGEVVRQMPPVAAAVRALQAEEGRRLALIYPGGESGELWAAELRDWLIALGVDADAVSIRAGAPEADTLLLRVRQGGRE
jgi:nucleotide-binding universal stress UspA family protein